jgi:2-polyprenyl-3-methyl-5-hydroxy-6-metoxy-1,4-benzoquinol methylase
MTGAPSSGGCAYGREGHDGHHGYLLGPVQDLLRGSLLPGATVLDAGCGDGAGTRALRDAGYDMFGCDVSSSGITLARERWPTGRFEQASVYDDLRAVFARSDPFHAIVALEVIEHLFAPRTFLDRAHEALRPGGLLILSTPYHGYLKNVALAVSGKLESHFTALWDGGHIKFWSRRSLSQLLRERDFEPLEFRGVGRAPWLWKSMIMTARRSGG